MQASKDVSSDGSSFGLLIGDIQHYLSVLPSSSFIHVFREANSVAHKAASFALQCNLSVSWYGPIPEVCQGFLASVCTL